MARRWGWGGRVGWLAGVAAQVLMAALVCDVRLGVRQDSGELTGWLCDVHCTWVCGRIAESWLAV